MYSPPSKENEKQAPKEEKSTKPASPSAVQHKGTGYSEQHASLSPDSQDFAEQRQALEPVQMKDGASTEGVHAAAEAGTQGAGGSLPHLDTIQKSFGSHDVSSVQAYTGGAATEASQSMGAQAYATGNKVAFGSSPSLHTAAHEAAHVVQQRAGVVSLKGGVGQSGDAYEQHADAVADAVVAGKSAEPILSQMASSSPAHSAVVQAKSVQRDEVTYPYEIEPGLWMISPTEYTDSPPQSNLQPETNYGPSLLVSMVKDYLRTHQGEDGSHPFVSLTEDNTLLTTVIAETLRWFDGNWAVGNPTSPEAAFNKADGRDEAVLTMTDSQFQRIKPRLIIEAQREVDRLASEEQSRQDSLRLLGMKWEQRYVHPLELELQQAEGLVAGLYKLLDEHPSAATLYQIMAGNMISDELASFESEKAAREEVINSVRSRVRNSAARLINLDESLEADVLAAAKNPMILGDYAIDLLTFEWDEVQGDEHLQVGLVLQPAITAAMAVATGEDRVEFGKKVRGITETALTVVAVGLVTAKTGGVTYPAFAAALAAFSASVANETMDNVVDPVNIAIGTDEEGAMTMDITNTQKTWQEILIGGGGAAVEAFVIHLVTAGMAGRLAENYAKPQLARMGITKEGSYLQKAFYSFLKGSSTGAFKGYLAEGSHAYFENHPKHKEADATEDHAERILKNAIIFGLTFPFAEYLGEWNSVGN